MSLYFVIALAVLAFIGLRLFMVLKVKLKKGQNAPELSGSYRKAVRSGQRALFYFYSPSCGACRTMTPVVEELSKEKKNCFLIDVQNDMVTPSAFGVMATPSTVIVEDGKIMDFLVGAQSKRKLSAMVD